MNTVVPSSRTARTVRLAEAQKDRQSGESGRRGPVRGGRYPIAPLILTALVVWLIDGQVRWTKARAGAADNPSVLRYDPATETLVPVPPEERKLGHIYRRFSPRLNRWVWSFYEGHGEFSFALGEGTVQPAQRLDLRLTAEQVEEAIESAAPGMSEAIKDFGGRVYVRLDREDQWNVYGPFGAPNAYDAETGRRWENHGGRYIPVSHTTGYRWAIRDGRYVPATISPGGGCGGGCQ